MARVIRRHWATDPDAAPSRRDRRSCNYDAYVPDVLAGRRIALDGDTAADVADAERAIATLDAGAVTLADTEALARILLRSFTAVNGAITRLLADGILQQTNVGRRNRAFEAPAIIEAFTDLERQLASPEGNTRTSEPARRVPRRR
jgi:hypothetical protein